MIEKKRLSYYQLVDLPHLCELILKTTLNPSHGTYTFSVEMDLQYTYLLILAQKSSGTGCNGGMEVYLLPNGQTYTFFGPVLGEKTEGTATPSIYGLFWEIDKIWLGKFPIDGSGRGMSFVVIKPWKYIQVRSMWTVAKSDCSVDYYKHQYFSVFFGNGPTHTSSIAITFNQSFPFEIDMELYRL